MPFDLDRIDLKILDVLQREGRVPMTELAERVGLSASPCTERVRRMEREGVITGYHAHVKPEALGRHVLVFVEIKLSSKSGDVFDVVRREMLHLPELLECHLVTGSFDYLLKFRLRNMAELRKLLAEVLKKLPVNAESNSYVVMEEVKDSVALPTDR